MKKSLLNLSGKIDGQILGACEVISNVAAALDIPFFIVGATARDIILQHGHNAEIQRATMDLDLGVQVKDWKQYEKLKTELIATGEFVSSKEEQRLIYQDSYPVDIVPFGSLIGTNGQIFWPPRDDTKMSILGFEEAYGQAIQVRLKSNPDLDVAVASLAGLTIMKIIAWDDNYPNRRRDAYDLDFIIQRYMDTIDDDRLSSEDSDLLDDTDFDYVLTGIRLLGRDIAAIANPKALAHIMEILDRETCEGSEHKLVNDMLRGSIDIDGAFDIKLYHLNTLKQGIHDYQQRKGAIEQ